VRELQNTIERAVILAEENKHIEPACLGLIHLADAAAPAPCAPAPRPIWEVGPALPSDGVKPLDVVEREHILRALDQTQGNRTQAAHLLKISIRTLRNKLNEYKVVETLAA